MAQRQSCSGGRAYVAQLRTHVRAAIFGCVNHALKPHPGCAKVHNK